MINSVNKLSWELYVTQQRFASSSAGTALLAIWSFLEAICWFILPDYLLLIHVALCPTHAKRFAILSLVSSMAGSIVMLFLAARFPEQVGHFLFTLPFTSADMLSKTQHLEHSFGVSATLLQPVSGIPAKVWTYAAVYHFHWNLLVFWGLLAVSRGVRMALISFIGWVFGRYYNRELSAFWPIWLTLYTFLFFLFLTKISS